MVMVTVMVDLEELRDDRRPCGGVEQVGAVEEEGERLRASEGAVLQEMDAQPVLISEELRRGGTWVRVRVKVRA